MGGYIFTLLFPGASTLTTHLTKTPPLPPGRLQPSAIVTEERCAACDFNRPGKTCLRKMDWVWRGETFAATRAEYLSLKSQLQSESFPPLTAGGPSRGWFDLPSEDRSKILKQRLKNYCQKVRVCLGVSVGGRVQWLNF